MAEDPPRPSPSADGPPAGLASERTSLAWTRTVLAIIVAGALLLRTGAGLGGSAQLPGGVTIAAGLLLLVVTLRRSPGPASHALLRTIGIGVTLLCVASLVLTLTGL